MESVPKQTIVMSKRNGSHLSFINIFEGGLSDFCEIIDFTERSQKHLHLRAHAVKP
jgi:hypothetical protein